MTLQDTLLDLEEQFWRAAGNGDFYRERFADEGRLVFPIGVLTREQAIPAVDASEPWASFRFDSARLIEISDDAAVLTYRATANRTGETPHNLLISSVYVRRDGEWKMLLHQQTPLQAAG